ncbi:MAG: endolytic transglycosylase MltG [Selenomonadaceae bacterium]|nr:endolytic transglycosylase MltG [Selenomonadaceae bacterium]
MKVEKVDDDKNSAAESEKKSEPVPIKKFNLTEKILSPFVAVKEMFAELSPKYIISVAAAVFFCIFVIAMVLIFADPQPIKNSAQGDSDNRIIVKVTAGMTTAEIADQLANKGVISSSLKFRFISRVRGYDGKMKPGTYTFSAGMTDEDVFEKILSGAKQLVRFTIPEGFTVKEIAERLYDLNLVDKEDFLRAATNFSPFDYMKTQNEVHYKAEGFLFPETYSVESDYAVEEILKTMADEFDRRLTDEMRARARELNLSIYDLVTLASLVEKEVRYDEDRPVVAQIFLKRLKMEMPLQSDATLQYLMDAPKEDVSIEDTKIESPYNSYQNAGLPPGPVANPGTAAIEAVLYPADTDYLYFVADREGHNHYSYSYEEHLNLVNQYR